MKCRKPKHSLIDQHDSNKSIKTKCTANCANYGSNSQSPPSSVLLYMCMPQCLCFPLEHIVHSIPSWVAKWEENSFACFGFYFFFGLRWRLYVCNQFSRWHKAYPGRQIWEKRIRIRMNLITEKNPSLGAE